MKRRANNKPKNKSVLEYQQKIIFIKQFDKLNFRAWKKLTPSQKSQITRKYNRLKSSSLDKKNAFIRASPREIKKYKAVGFRTTSKGVIVAKIKNKWGEPLRHQDIRLTARNAIVRVGKRTDKDFFLTKKQKIETAKDTRVLNKLAKKFASEIKKAKGDRVQAAILFSNGVHKITSLDPSKLGNLLADSARVARKYIIGVRVIHWRKK